MSIFRIIAPPLFILFLAGCSHNSNKTEKEKQDSLRAKAAKTNPRILKAICRPDNDFVTYKDSASPKEEIPAPVNLQIDSIVNAGIRDYCDSAESRDSAVLDEQAFKIKYSDDIALYVVKINYDAPLCINYYLIAYNKNNYKVSHKIPMFYGVYMENNEEGFSKKLLSPPLLRIEDACGVKNAIAVKRRAHNGTVYNAVITYYYKIDEDMNIVQLLKLESFAPDYADSNYAIGRRLTDAKIVDSLYYKGKAKQKIGEVKLEFGEPVNVISEKEASAKYKPFLISSDPDNSDTAFFRR